MNTATYPHFLESFLKSAKFSLITALLAIFVSAAFVVLAAGSAFAAPIPELASPAHGQAFSSPAPVLIGSAPQASEVLVFIDGSLNGIAKVLANTFSYVPFLPLSSGTHAIQLQSRDAATHELSNRGSAVLITIIPNPKPTFLAPEAGAALGSDRAWVGGVAANNSLVRILVDGTERARVRAKNHASGTASFGVQLKDLPLGEHVITAIARDFQGKESFLSDPLAITILPSTPAPILFRPVVNADSGIERPFITGIAKNGLVVSIIINGKVAQSIPLGQDPSGTISFSFQPPVSLGLGRHTIEAYASDRGKLSINSAAHVWQVGEAPLAANGSIPGGISDTTKEQGAQPPIAVKEQDTPKPLTVTDRLGDEGEELPVVPDSFVEDPDAPAIPQGRVIADDDVAFGGSEGAARIVQGDIDEEGGADDEVIEIAPGTVVRQNTENANDFTFNTSLVIGIVILIFLLLSILVWYIQEKRAQLGERVVSIFREDDEPGKGSASGDVSQHKVSDRFRGDDDMPPPPPPMF
ncbi:MAG: hypothetical protein Q8P78_02005 [bacterium]|nr:hypothetical protein [bacterium]